MITRAEIEKQLKSDRAKKIISQDKKRVIIPVKKGIKLPWIPYITWSGEKKNGYGMLFLNETDQRSQFLEKDIGIIIGHEGLCPSEDGNSLILRSDAIRRYLEKNPNALDDKTHLEQAINYFQKNVFRHALNDVTQWDALEVPDIWSSSTDWLLKNFDTQDIYDSSGNIKSVISAAKIHNKHFDAIFIGPNIFIQGLGMTGKNGSWAISQNGAINLCVDEVFKQTYQYL